MKLFRFWKSSAQHLHIAFSQRTTLAVCFCLNVMLDLYYQRENKLQRWWAEWESMIDPIMQWMWRKVTLFRVKTCVTMFRYIYKQCFSITRFLTGTLHSKIVWNFWKICKIHGECSSSCAVEKYGHFDCFCLKTILTLFSDTKPLYGLIRFEVALHDGYLWLADIWMTSLRCCVKHCQAEETLLLGN